MKFISIQLRFQMWQAVRRWQPTTLTTLTTWKTWTTLTTLTTLTSQSILIIQVEFSNPDLQIEMFMTLGRSSALRNAMSPKKEYKMQFACFTQTESGPCSVSDIPEWVPAAGHRPTHTHRPHTRRAQAACPGPVCWTYRQLPTLPAGTVRECTEV